MVGIFRRPGPKPEAVPEPAAERASFAMLFGDVARSRPAAPEAPELEPEPAAAPAGPAPTPAAPAIDPSLAALAPLHQGIHYLTPGDLSVTSAPPRRVALIGSCLLDTLRLQETRPDDCEFDLFLTDHGAEPPETPPAEYDFQIVQIALRSVFPDDLLWHIPYADLAAHERAFEAALKRLRFQLRRRMRWNIETGLLSFVANFPVPQRSLMGGLLPRYDLRNPEYFVGRLNERMEFQLRNYRNAYLLDMDRICASFGRRYVQDDAIDTVSHGAAIGLSGIDSSRVETLAPMIDHYEVTWPRFLPDAVWAEARWMHRIARQIDPVKLVIVDLDDTLWQGTSGEIAEPGPEMVGGWPLGLAEALMYLRKRGVLIAIVSRNEESRIRKIWPAIFGNRIGLDDFAAVRIGWRSKPEMVAEILRALNLLPESTLFIDDSPAERAAIGLAFPGIRVLGRHPYYLRRILLWSAETQAPGISAEAARRTEMAPQQGVREADREVLTRADFLAAAAPKLRVFWLAGADDPKFPHALELLYRTRQFNTTGARWTEPELRDFLAGGGRILAYEADDRYTEYGLVGAVLVRGEGIEQWVMSCRVLGYELERAVLALVVADIRAHGSATVMAKLTETAANFPCRELFANGGFQRDGESWRLAPEIAPTMPGHFVPEAA